MRAPMARSKNMTLAGTTGHTRRTARPRNACRTGWHSVLIVRLLDVPHACTCANSKLTGQRMKARVEELQAKVEQLEGTKQGQSIPASSNANASPTMITAGMNAPDKFSSMSSNGALFATRRDSQLGSAYQPGAPTANMMPSTSPNATRNHSIAMMRPNSVDSRSQASHHMANFDLLNSSAVPSSMAQEMSTNMALNNLHLQSTPFGDHNPCFDYFGGEMSMLCL